jgi:hypothetical protein
MARNDASNGTGPVGDDDLGFEVLDFRDGDSYVDDMDDVEDMDDIDIVDFGDVVAAVGLPGELPPVRLPPRAELAAQAAVAPLPGQLAALAAWSGESDRIADSEGDLSAEDMADGARALGVTPEEFGYLWEYALTADWLDFAGEEQEGGEDDEDDSLVVPSEMAASWSSGEDTDVLRAWRKTMVSVLSSTLDVAADASPELAALFDFEGQGMAMAVMLFLARGEGLPVSDLSEMLLESATADLDDEDASQASDEWVEAQGDPALLILRKLAEASAVTPPDDGVVKLTPLGLWALREELADVGIDIPLLPARTADMTADQLLLVAGEEEVGEFEATSDAWVAARDPEQAARELLGIAAGDGPDSRLLAVSVVTRIGGAAESAWRDSLEVPELRPYAKMALTGLAVESSAAVQPDLEPLPEDLAWVATDVLAIACDDEDPDPDAIVESFRDTVPAGEEPVLFDLMSRGVHPDALGVLQHVSRYHPDKNIASQARTAASKAASHRDGPSA